MAKRVKAKLNSKPVEVSCLSPQSQGLTIYEFIDNETVSMNVLCHAPRQDYLINEDTGLIKLKTNLIGEKLYIKPFALDEITHDKKGWA